MLKNSLHDSFLGEWFRARQLLYRKELLGEFVAETWLAMCCSMFVTDPSEFPEDLYWNADEYRTAATLCDIADMLRDLTFDRSSC